MDQLESDVGSKRSPAGKRRLVSTLALIAAVAAAPFVAALACSNAPANTFPTASGNGGSGAGTTTGGSGGKGGDDIFTDSGPPASAIDISPKNPILKVDL